MTDSPIPPSALPLPPSLPSGGEVRAQIVDLPEALQVLARSVRVEGEVVAVSREGQVRVQTPQGEVVLLMRGRDVPQLGAMLDVVLAGGKPPRLAQVAVAAAPVPAGAVVPGSALVGGRPLVPDGIPILDAMMTAMVGAGRISPAPLTAAQSLVQQIIRMTPVPMSVLANAAAGDVIETVLAPSGGPVTARAGAMPSLGMGEAARVLVGATPPLVAGSAALFAGDGVSGRSFAPSLLPGAVTVSPGSALLQAGPAGAGMAVLRSVPTEAIVRGVGFGTGSALTQMPFAGGVSAVVVARSAAGAPVLAVQWPGSAQPVLAVMTSSASPLAVGTELHLVPLSGQGGAPVSTQWMDPSVWPEMDEAFQVLAAAGDAAAVGAGRMVLPNAAHPRDLGPAAMLFLMAARAGDLSAWMGDAALDLLRKAGKADLPARLAREMSQAVRGGSAATEASGPSQDWRSISLPLQWQGQVHRIQLHERREESSEREGGRGEGGRRFVLDMTPSRMGAVQLDGFFAPGRMDLVVRTEAPLSRAMQEDMRRLYLAALEEATLRGTLNFQDRPEYWVKISPSRTGIGVSA